MSEFSNLMNSFSFWVKKKLNQFGDIQIKNHPQEWFSTSFSKNGNEILIGFFPNTNFGGAIGKYHNEPIVKVFFDENKKWSDILEHNNIKKLENVLSININKLKTAKTDEQIIKTAIGLHIVPLYNIPETQEQKEFDCDFTDRSPIGDDKPIAPMYDKLYLGPLRRTKYSSKKEALDYSSLSPFVQHQYGTGYDGNNSQNRSEFPRHWPFQRHNFYTKITDGDYDPSEYSEGNPSLLSKRDCEEKYRDTDYTNLDDNRTQHYRDHNMNQNTLELLGCILKDVNNRFAKGQDGKHCETCSNYK